MKNKKKKKQSFYKNKNRNQQWTEPPQGRPISFADKYAEGSGATDKYDFKRSDSKAKTDSALKKQKLIKRLIVAFISIALICTGYIGADVYMIRRENPAKSVVEENKNTDGGIANISIEFSSLNAQSVSFDNSVMLSSVIDEAFKNGYTAVTFDAKRSDGTVGYASNLALIETYGAISSASSKPKESIKSLLDNGILPVARLSCYKDSLVPSLNPDLAVRSGGKIYKDKDGYTYLNPNDDSVYSYIKDIVTELSSYGVNVFMLADCSLPEKVSKSYNDGFEALSSRLTNDLGKDIKFVEEVDVTVTGIEPESGNVNTAGIKHNISKFPKLKQNQVYFVTVKTDIKKTKELIDKSGIKAYTLED